MSRRQRWAIAWIGLQILTLGGWASVEAYHQQRGTVIRVRTVPVDPRDLLRGQYLILNYPFSRMDCGPDLQPGQTVWVRLQSRGPFFEPDGCSTGTPTLTRAAGTVLLRGTAAPGGGLRFGIEKYFFPERLTPPDTRNLTVDLRVLPGGEVRIERLWDGTRPWPG